MCEHGVARIVIGSQAADGSVHTRAWTVSACFAEHLATQMGPPHSEAVASPEGVADVRRAVRDVPGIIRAERGAG